MLTIVLPATDDLSELELKLEHSLVSLSKWESIYEKPFYGKEEMSPEESVSYMKQMILNDKVPDDFEERIKQEHVESIKTYINAKQSATWFPEDPKKGGSREVVTSELIYYWMISFQIPFSCENWHVNRLMTLIRICGVKQTKPKKMSKSALAEQYRNLNAQRRRELGTNG